MKIEIHYMNATDFGTVATIQLDGNCVGSLILRADQVDEFESIMRAGCDNDTDSLRVVGTGTVTSDTVDLSSVLKSTTQDILANASMQVVPSHPPKPICTTCNDSHVMTLGTADYDDEREVMCTHCPSPCQKCRVAGTGPYCTTTPCSCTCHSQHWQYRTVTK